MKDIKEDFLQWFIKFLTKIFVMQTKEQKLILAQFLRTNNSQKELHKPILWKFEKRKRHSNFTDNVWGVDLPDMKLLSKFNKGICFLLCVIHIFSKYGWVVPLKNQKGITITEAFQKKVNESGCKPNKIWVGKRSKLYNTSMKSFNT